MSARPTVVLLHSSGASARQWDALARSLVECFDVHAIDLHGHGARAAWAGPRALTLADEAAPVDALIERRGAVHLVGHSYGGAVAMDVARRHPRAVRSLVLFEPAAFGLLDDDRAGAACAAEIGRLAGALRDEVTRDLPSAARRFVDYWAGAGTWAAMPEQRQAAVLGRMPSVVAHFDTARAAPDARAALARLPLLCLSGSASPEPAQRIAARLQASLPRATHRRLAGVGHMAPLTDSALVNALITDFLLSQAHPARPLAAAFHPQPQTA